MVTIPHNPFTNRSTIKNERDFVGREQEITHILSRVRNGDSVSVVVFLKTLTASYNDIIPPSAR